VLVVTEQMVALQVHQVVVAAVDLLLPEEIQLETLFMVALEVMVLL
jgi:hypothetical protein